jgi:hypothetical protein
MNMSRTRVSIVTGCRNRASFLLQSLPTWLACPVVNEIIVVDWGSQPPLELPHNPTVRLLRVEGVSSWILSSALNFGLSQANEELILKLDCDHKLHREFFTQHPLSRTSEHFYAGNWQIARNENERHINGSVFLTREQFLASGGYNEHITSYGWDDTDLYQRLVVLGYTQKDISPDYLDHIPHENDLRSEREPQLEILKNMHLVKYLPWSRYSDSTRYELLTQVSPNQQVYRALNLFSQLPLPKISTRCEHLALVSALHSHNSGIRLSWRDLDNQSDLVLKKMWQQRDRPILWIEPKNGLGNRLRALASAAVIARKSERNLVIVWIRDEHCEASMDELFDCSELFWIDSPPEREPTLTSSATPANPTNPEFISIPTGTTKIPSEGTVYVASACVLNSPLTDWNSESWWLIDNLRVREPLQREIRHYSDVWNIRDAIGVHIRMGQTVSTHSYEDSSGWDDTTRKALELNRSDSHYWYFMKEMERIWRTQPEQTFLLCADDQAIYDAFQARYPQRIARTIHWVPKSSYDRSITQLQGALVDIYLLSKCQYILGSPWSSFTELAVRLGRIPGKLAGKDFGTTRYGLLFYPKSYNLGDDIQSLAATRFLPQIHYLVDRDNQSDLLYDLQGAPLGEPSQVLGPHKRLRVIENGWFDTRLTRFPLHAQIDPLWISVHFNQSPDLFQQPGYQAITSFQLIETESNHKAMLEYLRSHRVGTRDEHTLTLLREAGVSAYHSCCLTLTLPLADAESQFVREEILIVDANIGESELLQSIVPEHIRKRAHYLSHALDELLPYPEKRRLAQELLQRYQRARLVITNRLHCALPCLAYRTPCLFLYSKMSEDPRFDTTLHELLGNGRELPSLWNWDHPEIPPQRLVRVAELVDQLVSNIES